MVLLEVVPGVLLKHTLLLQEFFDHIFASDNLAGTTFRGIVLGLEPEDITLQIVFRVFEQKPSAAYTMLASYIDDRKTRTMSLLLMGRMILAFRRHARRISETNAWASLIVLLRTETDPVTVSIGLWLLVLLIPHVGASLPGCMIDLLYILKRTMLEFPFLSSDRSSRVLVAQQSLHRDHTPRTPLPSPPKSNDESEEDTLSPQRPAKGIPTPVLPNFASIDARKFDRNAVEDARVFLLEFFRMLYTLFPRETLTFMQVECAGHKSLKTILERYLHSVRLHPALLSPASEENHERQQQRVGQEEGREELVRLQQLQQGGAGVEAEVDAEDTKTGNLSPGSIGAPGTLQLNAEFDGNNLAGAGNYTSNPPAGSFSTAASGRHVSSPSATAGATARSNYNGTKAWISLSPEEILSMIEELSINSHDKSTTRLKSRMPSLNMQTPKIVRAHAQQEPRTKEPRVEGPESSVPSSAQAMTSSFEGEALNTAQIGSLEKPGAFSKVERSLRSNNAAFSPVATRVDTVGGLSRTAIRSAVVGDGESDEPAAVGSGHYASSTSMAIKHANHLRSGGPHKHTVSLDALPAEVKLALVSNELLYERYLREQQEWKLRRIRRQAHAQSVQLEESRIWRKQLRAQVRISGDLQAAIAREREQAKRYKQGHKKWSADMRIKVMRQREEYVQIAERNVELQNSVNHLRETIMQLRANLSKARTQLFTLNGVEHLSKLADKAKKDAESEVVSLQSFICSMQQKHEARTDATLSAALENRDRIILRLGRKLAQAKRCLESREDAARLSFDGEGGEPQQRLLWLQAARDSVERSGPKKPDSAPLSGRMDPLDFDDTPTIIARLREHIASTISEGSETLTYHNMQTLLINEFGHAAFSRYKHIVQRELELASKVDPKSYNQIFYAPSRHTSQKKEERKSSTGARGSYSPASFAYQQNSASVATRQQSSSTAPLHHRRQQETMDERSILGHPSVQNLVDKSNKLEKLLNATRSTLGDQVQQLERRCMSACQVNIALEKRLMRAMQENETLSIQAKRMQQQAPEQNNKSTRPADVNESGARVFSTTRDIAPIVFGRRSTNMNMSSNLQQERDPQGDIKNDSQVGENLGQRMSDILVGALRASRQDMN